MIRLWWETVKPEAALGRRPQASARLALWLTLPLFCLLALPAAAHADSIAVGNIVLTYVDTTGQLGFQVNNLTGPSDGCGATVTGPNTGCYPVATILSFDDVSLTATYTVNGGPVQTLSVTIPSSDDSYMDPGNAYCGVFGVDPGCGDANYALAFSAPVGEIDLLSATITGTLSPDTGITLTDGSTPTLVGTFSATLTDVDCTSTAAFNGDGSVNFSNPCSYDSTDLVADEGTPGGGGGGSPSPVPEPSSAALWMAALAALGWMRGSLRGKPSRE